MRPIELETTVLTAIDRIRSNQQGEHDLLECKRSWPTADKARQLAGSLNRAGGDPVIYIIGIDEETGEIHDVSDVDIHDWWMQFKRRFDQTPPEMIRHIPVAVGSQHVVAIAFASDRAPYLVRPKKDNPALEVPMREGTGTRSAHRDELLRLLIPGVTVPSAVPLEASLYAEHYPEVLKGNSADMAPRAGGVEMHGRARIYFEHASRVPSTLPAHGMTGRLVVDDAAFKLKIRPARRLIELPGSNAPTMSPVPDGVTLTGPVAVGFDLTVTDFEEKDINALQLSRSVSFAFEFEVLHAQRKLKLDIGLSRDAAKDMLATEYQVYLGEWSFGHPGL